MEKEGVGLETEQMGQVKQTPNWEVDHPQEKEPEKRTMIEDDYDIGIKTRYRGKNM